MRLSLLALAAFTAIPALALPHLARIRDDVDTAGHVFVPHKRPRDLTEPVPETGWRSLKKPRPEAGQARSKRRLTGADTRMTVSSGQYVPPPPSYATWGDPNKIAPPPVPELKENVDPKMTMSRLSQPVPLYHPVPRRAIPTSLNNWAQASGIASDPHEEDKTKVTTSGLSSYVPLYHPVPIHPIPLISTKQWQ